MKNKYLQTLEEKIKKVKNTDHLQEQISLLLTDVKEYLHNEQQDEGCTTQSLVGMKHLFRGWIVKNWTNVQEAQPKRMHSINKIVIKQSVIFYAEAWKHRNEIKHDPEKCRPFVIDWYNKVVELIENDNRPEMNKYLRAQRLNVQACDNACIRQWIISSMDMRKKAKKERTIDIRRFFSMRAE